MCGVRTVVRRSETAWFSVSLCATRAGTSGGVRPPGRVPWQRGPGSAAFKRSSSNSRPSASSNALCILLQITLGQDHHCAWPARLCGPCAPFALHFRRRCTLPSSASSGPLPPLAPSRWVAPVFCRLWPPLRWRRRLPSRLWLPTPAMLSTAPSRSSEAAWAAPTPRGG